MIIDGLQRVRPGVLSPRSRATCAAGRARRSRPGRIKIGKRRKTRRADTTATQPGKQQGLAKRMARFFIDRPVLGVVISAVILLAGLAAVKILPIAQYPEITPPTVQVSCSYPGASAKVVRDTVAAPIEQEVNGVERMLYMSSQSTNDGGYNLTVTFELGTNLDMAQVLVQNRVNLAMPRLPDAVKATGVSTKKKSPSILLVVNFTSDEDPKTHKPLFDQLYLSNFATIQDRDDLARLKGVGDVAYMGQQDYSMRVWLDPEKLAPNNLTASDVVNVLKEQNVQVAAGQIGQQPVPTGQDFQYTLTTLGRLVDPAAVRANRGEDGQVGTGRPPQGRFAEIELGAKNQDTRCTLDGKPSIGLVIYQLPGSNALDTAKSIRAKMKELAAARFPKGLHYSIVYDTTPFIKESVAEVFHALRDAVILVAIVVLLFLQDWKAMILPMIDVPVSLVGTFAVMYLMGFTLNNLTLFGLVLAIGIVVDDAIVVLEAVETKLAQGLDARTATIKAMGEITGAIIAITLVLCSVFLPSALHRRDQRPVLSAVRVDDRRLDGHLGDQCHDDDPVAGRPDLQGRQTRRTRTRRYARGAAVVGIRRPVGLAGAELLWSTGCCPYREEHVRPRGSGLEGLAALVAAARFPAIVSATLFARPVNRILSRFFKWFNRGFDFVAADVRPSGRGIAADLRDRALDLWRTDRADLFRHDAHSDRIHSVAGQRLSDRRRAAARLGIARANGRRSQAHRRTGARHERRDPHDRHSRAVVRVECRRVQSGFDVHHPRRIRASARPLAELGPRSRKLQKQFYADILEAQVAVFGAPAVDGLGNAGGFKLMVEDSGRPAARLRCRGSRRTWPTRGANSRELPGCSAVFARMRRSSISISTGPNARR